MGSLPRPTAVVDKCDEQSSSVVFFLEKKCIYLPRVQMERNLDGNPPSFPPTLSLPPNNVKKIGLLYRPSTPLPTLRPQT
jgi:hypothetical protein